VNQNISVAKLVFHFRSVWVSESSISFTLDVGPEGAGILIEFHWAGWIELCETYFLEFNVANMLFIYNLLAGRSPR